MKTITRWFAACVLLNAVQVVADDIEIYLGEDDTSVPYLHFLMDARPSTGSALCRYNTSCKPPFFSEKAYAYLAELEYSGNDAVEPFSAFQAVIATVFADEAYDPLHVALLISNNQDNPLGDSSSKIGGGTILEGYKQLGGGTPQGRIELIETILDIPIADSNDAAKLQPKEGYFEWFRYISDGNVALGTNTSGNFGVADPNAAGFPDYDASIMLVNDTKYDSPFQSADECPKLFSITVAMNTPNADTDLDAEIALEMDSSLASPNNSFDNMLAWLHRSDTDLVPQISQVTPLQKSWIISDSGSLGQTPKWADTLGTKLLTLDNPAELEEELKNIGKEIISVSSTFVAASVPVNVFNQVESLDNLFIALFEAQDFIDWPGNLKKLKLADTFDPNAPNDPSARDGIFDEIVDVNGNPGFETSGDNRGRIYFSAETFWTDVDALPDPNSIQSASSDPNNPDYVPAGADGRVVTRGGAGQKIDGFVGYDDPGNPGTPVTYVIGNANVSGSRQVHVEPASITNGSSNAFDDFDADATTRDNLKSLLDPDPVSGFELNNNELVEVIKWGRGQDTANNSSAARTWILADAIHSRPFALNYGTAGGAGYSKTNPNIRIFMGTNDGLFHIIENTDASGNETGREVFAFYPRDVLGNIKLRKEGATSSEQMRYGVDGEPVVFTLDNNKDGTLNHSDGDEAYVYFGLRRGGYSYFALDVSNPAVTPTLKWKITQTSGGDFDELGLTFSTPVVGKVKYGDAAVDVLIFGGGYNGGWNADYTARVGKDLNANDDAIGNAIYIVNARTGALIWKAVLGATRISSNTAYEHAGLVDSIPSSVTALENLNGTIHRIYVGDTGGAVWRVDLPEGTGADTDHRKDNWFITKLADLGADAGETGGSAANDLRFFHAPDVVETYDDNGNFDGLVFESGNRADPNEEVVENYLFYIKDREIVSGSPTVKAENDVSDPPGRYVFDEAESNGLIDQTACVTGAETVFEGGSTIACADRALFNGWKIEFERSGEKGLSAPLVDFGRIFATTFRPGGAEVCAPSEGNGSVYVVNLADGTATANNERIYDIGRGIPPGAVLVGDVILIPGGGIDLYDEDGDGVPDNSKLPQSLTKKLYQIYWREPGIDQL